MSRQTLYSLAYLEENKSWIERIKQLIFALIVGIVLLILSAIIFKLNLKDAKEGMLIILNYLKF